MPTYAVVAQSPGGFRVPVTLSIVSEFPAAKIGVNLSLLSDNPTGTSVRFAIILS